MKIALAQCAAYFVFQYNIMYRAILISFNEAPKIKVIFRTKGENS